MEGVGPTLTKCTSCKREFPRTKEHFFRYKLSADGFRRQCKECHMQKVRSNPKHTEQKRNAALKKYGLTLVEFEEMLKRQEGKCAICGKTPKENLCVDHCHRTGKVRGLLCRACNRSIGQLGDTEEALMKAVHYLKETH